MDPPSSSSPGRDDVELQYELEQIAFQMELDKQADIDAVESALMLKVGTRMALGLEKGLGRGAGGRIRSIHTRFRKEKAVQWRRLIRITNRNNVR